MSRILVTGATGFVGKSLVPVLVKESHDVICAVTRKVDWLNMEQHIINRIEDQLDWSDLLSGVDVVIHLAARVHIMNDKTVSPIDEYRKVNSVATKTLAEQAAKCGVKRFIYMSSIKVNGEFTNDRAFTEGVTEIPKDPYGVSKLYAEQYIQEISKTTGMEFVILRPPLVYGPEVKANFLSMIQLVNKGWPLPFGNVNNKRSFVYVENLVSALCAVIIHPMAANQIYLVADNESWSLTNLLKVIANKMNKRILLFPMPINLITRVFKLLGLNNFNQRLFGSLEVSNSKIKSELKWVPPYTSVEGMDMTVEWFKNKYSKLKN